MSDRRYISDLQSEFLDDYRIVTNISGSPFRHEINYTDAFYYSNNNLSDINVLITVVSCGFPVFEGSFYFSKHICVEMLVKPEPKVLEQMLKTYKNSKWVDFKDVNRP